MRDIAIRYVAEYDDLLSCDILHLSGGHFGRKLRTYSILINLVRMYEYEYEA